MQKLVSDKGSMVLGYFTRNFHRITTTIRNVKMEDLKAFISFDAGAGTCDIMCIPSPMNAQTFSIEGEKFTHIREQYIRQSLETELLDHNVDYLIKEWDKMHGVIPVMKLAALSGYSVDERGTTQKAQTAKGYLAFMSSADYESPSMISERLRMCAIIISRFMPGIEVEVQIPEVGPDGIYVFKDMKPFRTRASPRTSLNPNKLLQLMVEQIKYKLEGEGLMQRIQSKASEDLSMLYAWETYVGSAINGGKIVLNDWIISNALALIAEFDNLFDYDISVGTSSYTSLDLEMLDHNIQAARKMYSFIWRETKKKMHIPLTRDWFIESSTGDWSITMTPEFKRIDYVESNSNPLTLAGWPVQVMFPRMKAEVMSLALPDYAADTSLRTFYRTTRSWETLIGVQEIFIDPNILVPEAKGRAEFIANFELALTAIDDKLSAKSFLRTSRGGPGMSENKDLPNRTAMEQATNSIKPILEKLGLKCEYVLPINGSKTASIGSIKGRRAVAGYAITIQQNEDTIASPVVALRWTDDTRRELTYKYQEVREDVDTGLRAS